LVANDPGRKEKSRVKNVISDNLISGISLCLVVAVEMQKGAKVAKALVGVNQGFVSIK
jgi:hypothetical protein